MTDEPDQPIDRDLEQMAGDPRVARAIKADLIRLSNGAAGAEMAEMARDLLAGRIDLRTVAQSSAYSEQLTEAATTYDRWRSELTPERREELASDTHRAISEGRDGTGQPR